MKSRIHFHVQAKGTRGLSNFYTKGRGFGGGEGEDSAFRGREKIKENKASLYGRWLLLF